MHALGSIGGSSSGLARRPPALARAPPPPLVRRRRRSPAPATVAQALKAGGRPGGPSPSPPPTPPKAGVAAAAASSSATASATSSPTWATANHDGNNNGNDALSDPALLLDANGALRRRHTVFNFERWETHRSSSRYFRHMSSIFRSRTFLNLSAPIAFITAFATFAGVYESVAVPKGLAPEINIGDVPLQITAFALSLLLTTRTESSNKRYEEALTVWSQVVRNESKDIARQSLYWVSEAQAPVRAALVRWAAAFSRALMCHCRPDGDALLGPVTRGVLLPHESAALAAEGAGSAPAMVLQVLAELVEQADVPGIRRENMFSTLRELGGAVGRCEKLIRYPLPLAWTRHTSRFLIMWLMALPFALWEDCGWGVVPISNLCGLLLLGIDSIGVELEDAMRAVDIEGICDDVSSDVIAMLERQERVAGMLRDSGVETCASRACGRTWALGSLGLGSADEESDEGGEEEGGGGGGLGAANLLPLASLASGVARRGIAVMSDVPVAEDDDVGSIYKPYGRYTRTPSPVAQDLVEEGLGDPPAAR
jgi:predicted membrane chloride channel (bestrophin family)